MNKEAFTKIVKTVKRLADFYVEQTETGEYSKNYSLGIRHAVTVVASEMINAEYGIDCDDSESVSDYLKISGLTIKTEKQIAAALTRYLKSEEFADLKSEYGS